MCVWERVRWEVVKYRYRDNDVVWQSSLLFLYSVCVYRMHCSLFSLCGRVSLSLSIELRLNNTATTMNFLWSLTQTSEHIWQARDFKTAVTHYTAAIEEDPQSETAALCLSNRSAAYQQYVTKTRNLNIFSTHWTPTTTQQIERIRKSSDRCDEMPSD